MPLNVISRDEDFVRLGCEGSVMPTQVTAESNGLEPLLGPAGFRTTVLLDLTHADYLGSTSINWLIGVHQRFRADGGRLVLHSLSPWLREVADLVRLPTVLHVAADEAAATALARGTCS
jgi:anti-anti-sigma factor